MEEEIVETLGLGRARFETGEGFYLVEQLGANFFGGSASVGEVEVTFERRITFVDEAREKSLACEAIRDFLAVVIDETVELE